VENAPFPYTIFPARIVRRLAVPLFSEPESDTG
jgi:hypothetical protein